MNAQQPWLKNKHWTNNSIRSNSKTGVFVLWGIAVLWNVISWPVMFQDGLFAQMSREPVTAIALLFPLIGVGLFVAAVHALVSWRKFGATPLTLDPFPGSLGGHVGGSIPTAIPYSDALSIQVSLSCVKSYMSGSGKDRSRKESLVWQTEGQAFAEPSTQGTDISFRFDTPDNLPESEPKTSSSYHLWRVSVHCDLPGADLNRQFEIPVYRGIRHSEQLAAGTEDFHGTIDSAQSGIYEIANITPIPGGMRAHFPAMKRPAGGIMAVLFGAIFFGAGWGLAYSDAPAFFPYVFGGIGLLILAFGIWDLGKSLQVTISRDGITARRFFLGYPITTRKVKTAQLSRISVEEGAKVSTGTRTTVYYSLHAHTNEGKSVTIAERLTSRPEVELLKESAETYTRLN